MGGGLKKEGGEADSLAISEWGPGGKNWKIITSSNSKRDEVTADKSVFPDSVPPPYFLPPGLEVCIVPKYGT